MATKIVRQMDDLGRVVLPKAFTAALRWTEKTKIAITQEGAFLVLKPDKGSCFLCGTEENFRPVRNRFLCSACIAEIKEDT